MCVHAVSIYSSLSWAKAEVTDTVEFLLLVQMKRIVPNCIINSMAIWNISGYACIIGESLSRVNVHDAARILRAVEIVQLLNFFGSVY